MFSNIVNTLSSDEIIANIGFGCGMFWNILERRQNNENPIIGFLNFPLSTILNSYCAGFAIMMGSQFMAHQLPKKIKFIIPISTCMSVIYYGYNQYKLIK